MNKSELEVLTAIIKRGSLPQRGIAAGRHKRHDKAIDDLKKWGIIYKDENAILQIKRSTY